MTDAFARLQDALAILAAEGLNRISEYVTKGSAAAAVIEWEAADHAWNRASLSVLAFYWYGYRCGSTQVYAGPFLTGGSGGGAPGTKTCHQETWTLDLGTGQTWPVSVSVCQQNW